MIVINQSSESEISDDAQAIFSSTNVVSKERRPGRCSRGHILISWETELYRNITILEGETSDDAQATFGILAIPANES